MELNGTYFFLRTVFSEPESYKTKHDLTRAHSSLLKWGRYLLQKKEIICQRSMDLSLEIYIHF